MENTLVVKDEVRINAPKEKVWDVLTNPAYIKQWDDIPENYPGGHLKLGSVIEWEGYSKLTVTIFEQNKTLTMNMFLPKVDLDTSKYDVNYKYSLAENNGTTILSFEIGDFSPLPHPQDYFDASSEFVEAAKEKIKDLAEQDA